jgi:protein SCO1/2
MNVMGSGFLSHFSNQQPAAMAVAALLLGVMLAGCGGEADSQRRGAKNTMSLDVDRILTDTTYTLINQDSSAVRFPDDFLGTPIVLGTIYTNCPNICPQITANMKTIREQLPDPSAVQFVSVTFDPQRDTPARLAAYRQQFDLSGSSWQFLTADTTTIGALMDRLDVRHTIKGTDRAFPAAVPDSAYVFNHSNQITLIDAQGRVRAEYAGSQTPPDLIVSDLEKIQP